MSNRHIILSLFVVVCQAVYGLTITQQQVDDALQLLDQELDNSQSYLDRRVSRIDSIRASLASVKTPGDELSTVLRLADEFTSFDNDSAIYYYNHGYYRALKMESDSMMTVFKLKRATFLPLAAFVKEAIDEYGSVDSVGLSREMLKLYHDAGRQMYSYIAGSLTV